MWCGCERLFSDYGIVHTKRRSRLSVENVRKTGIVRVDLKRTHIAEGYVRPRKRKFGEFEDSSSTTSGPSTPSTTSPTPPATGTTPTTPAVDPDDENDPLDIVDFTDLAAQLIRDAFDSDTSETPQASSSVQSTTIQSTPAARRNSRKTNIPLQDLFRYPRLTTDPWDGLDHYWKGGVRNLDTEMRLHEGLSEAASTALSDLDAEV